jgi:hypothetical protein
MAAGGAEESRGARRAGNGLHRRRRRLPDRARAHGRRSRHRAADRLEQGLHRGGTQALDPSFTTPPERPGTAGNEAFGIQWSFEGRFAAFVGGFPVVVERRGVGAA